MKLLFKPLLAAVAATLAVGVHLQVQAQATIKIGEVNSYKAQPAFLEPYKKGMDLAVEEINAAGGVLGKKIEVIIRDDNGNPGDAVRAAEELVSREGVRLETDFRRFIVPATASADPEQERGGRRSSSLPRPWDLFELHVLGIPARLLKPGGEYVIWFRFSDLRPTDVEP